MVALVACFCRPKQHVCPLLAFPSAWHPPCVFLAQLPHTNNCCSVEKHPVVLRNTKKSDIIDWTLNIAVLFFWHSNLNCWVVELIAPFERLLFRNDCQFSNCDYQQFNMRLLMGTYLRLPDITSSWGFSQIVFGRCSLICACSWVPISDCKPSFRGLRVFIDCFWTTHIVCGFLVTFPDPTEFQNQVGCT